MSTTTTKPKTTSARRTPSARTSAKKARRGTGDALPAWGDLPKTQRSGLSKKATRAKAGAKKASQKAAAKVKNRGRALDAVPSLRFGIVTLAVCLALTLFLGHAYATRATLDALQDARRDNDRLRLTHQRLQGDADRMTGPSAVMGRASSLGLEEGVAYGPTIRLAE